MKTSFFLIALSIFVSISVHAQSDPWGDDTAITIELHRHGTDDERASIERQSQYGRDLSDSILWTEVLLISAIRDIHLAEKDGKPSVALPAACHFIDSLTGRKEDYEAIPLYLAEQVKEAIERKLAETVGRWNDLVDVYRGKH